mgnify:CR=1 FL=1
MRRIYETHGLRSLYRGLGPTLVRDVPFSGIYWGVVESLKRRLNENFKERNRTTSVPPSFGGFHAFLSGFVGGTVATFFTTPMDLVKTRVQVNVIEGSSISSSSSSSSSSNSSGALGGGGGGHVHGPSCDHNGRTAAVASGNNNNLKIDGKSGSGSGSGANTAARVFKEILNEGGWRSLWAGNVARTLRVGPACAIMIGTFELGKLTMDA